MASIVTFSHTWIKAGILLHTDLTQVWKTKYHLHEIIYLFNAYY